MRLKNRNELLISEFNAAQNDVIKAGQIIHNEQHMMLNSRQMMTEEEAVVRSLKNELSTAKSYLTTENTKNRNLQSRMDEDIGLGMNRDFPCCRRTHCQENRMKHQ